jgi:hypothetical protein
VDIDCGCRFGVDVDGWGIGDSGCEWGMDSQNTDGTSKA